jgi:hypothetical protein
MLHNEKVKKNRQILERLIDAICFLSKQELAFRGHDESLTSLNKGNYIEVLNLMSVRDPVLKAHLKESTVFKGTSSAIQNDLIAAISAVVIENIKEDIKETNFVALILDETSDIINKSQLSTVLRFVDKKGEIQERFLGFTDVSKDRTALGLFNEITNFLKDYNCENKLIAQTYDGAAVMAGEVSGLNKRIQDVFPSAIFIHCYSHSLNLTLQQSVANIKECRLFFQTLSGLATFFSKSTKRTYALKQFLQKKLPSVAPTRWNFSSRLVNTVNEYYTMLKAFFQDILDASDEWDSDAILKAQGLLTFLEKQQTQFLLAVFSQIFCYSDVLFNTLQTKSLDISYCAKKIKEFSENLQEMRDQDVMFILDGIAIPTENSAEPRPTRSHVISDEVSTSYCKRLRNEIIDNIKAQICDRFKSINSFQFFSLLDCDKFKDHKKNFPDEKFKSLNENYGAHFDIVRLKTELTVLYSSSEFEQKSVTDILHFMHSNKLYMGMPEIFKLISLVSTIPATTSSAERSFSALRRIQNYLRSTQGQERLSSLALLSIEKSVLLEMKEKTSFYDRVIEKFVEKNRRIEFVYK